MRKFMSRAPMRFKILLGIPVAVGVIAIAGVAYAAWTSTGSGTVDAQSTTSANSTIAALAHAADLYPGAAKTVTVTVSNPNAYPIVVNSISTGSSALVNTLCVAGTVTIDARNFDATGLLQSDGTTKTIAAAGSGTYTLVTHMTTTAVDECKSQTFTLALTAAISSNA